MAGKIRQLVDVIIAKRAKGNPVVAQAVKAKLVLKGIRSDNYSEGTPDDPAVIKKLEILAKELGVTL